MFKLFKNKISGSTSDCCSITIKEVEDNQEDQNQDSTDGYEDNANIKKSCCD